MIQLSRGTIAGRISSAKASPGSQNRSKDFCENDAPMLDLMFRPSAGN